MQGNWQAPLMAALLVPFPLSSWLGLAAIALVTLRRGSNKGVIAGLAAVLAISLVTTHPVIQFCHWAEVIILLLCCALLRQTERLSMSLLGLVGLTTIFVLSLYQWGEVLLTSYEKTLLDAMKEIGISLPTMGMSLRDWVLQGVVFGIGLKV